MNGESNPRPRLGAFAGEPVPMTEFERTPSLSGWRPPPRLEGGRPDYGLDAPTIVAGSFALAAVSAVFGALLGAIRIRGRRIPVLGLVSWLLALGGAALGTSLVAYGRKGKLNHRDRVLELIAWRGDERVLDVGTGRGLLMIGAAKRLVTGRAFGVDTWRNPDLTHNNRENTMRNAFLEGVSDRIDVRFEDARKLGFQRNSFDVVFATLTLHNIEPRADRDAACREIARVLRPGGTAIVTDYANVGEYAAVFRAAGLDVRAVPAGWNTFTYLRTIVATKPPIVDLVSRV